MKKLILLLLLIPNLVMADNLSLGCKGILKTVTISGETGKTEEEDNDTFSFNFEDEKYVGGNWIPQSNYSDWSCSWSKQIIKCNREPRYKDKFALIFYSYIEIDRMYGNIETSTSYVLNPIATHFSLKFKGSCEVSKKNKF